METPALQCPKCGSGDVININYDASEGGGLSFYSCHRCEERWWSKDGQPLSLPDVLELQRRSRKPSDR